MQMRLRLAFVAGVGLAWLGLSAPQACAAAPSAEVPARPVGRPNVLLITVDTLRRDALGFLGGQNETPHLDALAAAGFSFPAAVSPVPMTLPAHTSILTGVLPRQHGVHDNGQLVGSVPETLAGRLQAGGYATAAFVSGYPLVASFGLDRGFAHYDDTLPEGSEGWVERRAGATTAAALAWIAQAQRPWFVWVHYFDPHDPYDPPRSFWKPGARGPYDGEVAYVDSAVGKLLAGAGEGPQLTIFTADHGEGLGDHGEKTHGFFVYDSTTLVPLVFHWPGKFASGSSPAAARLIDIAPTVLDLLGVPKLPAASGRSLAPILGGQPLPPAPAYVETQLPWRFFGWSPLAAIRFDGWKLVAAPRPELFDLADDPGEARNLLADGQQAGARERARTLREMLRGMEAQGPLAASGAAGGTDDPEALAKLQALGYLGAGAGTAAPPPGLADPKDRIAERDELVAADAAARAGRLDEALVRFDRVLAVEPRNRYATLRSGTALLQAGRLREAADRLEIAVAVDPERAEARFVLADALTRLGRHAQALPHWLELVRLQPRHARHWTNLAFSLRQNGQPERAAAAEAEAARLTAGSVPAKPAAKAP
jgi:choline-sulfatase